MARPLPRWLPALLPFLAGVLFSVGLAISGMTRPAKIVGFLDFAGRWDPSLAFVMLGAVGIYAVTFRAVKMKGRTPLLAARFSVPTQSRVDAALIAGAALFGVGWGLSGFCPGPALVSFGAGARSALWFVPATLAGMVLYQQWQRSQGGRRLDPLRGDPGTADG